MMRYWFDGADEGLEREAERRRELGLPPPDTGPSLCHLLVFVLAVASNIVGRPGRRNLGVAG